MGIRGAVGEVRVMGVASDTELDGRTEREGLAGLVGDLARMGLLTSQIMLNASAALLEDDPVLAEQVLARGENLDDQHHEVEETCLAHLALHDAVAGDPQTVTAALDAVRDLQQMGDLAQHTAKITKLAQPYLLFFPDDVRTVIAQMSLLASGLARQAATAMGELDPRSGERLVQTRQEVDELRRELLRMVFDENWPYGVEPAIHAALVGRYYECFADHAVAIARQVCLLAADPRLARTGCAAADAG